MNIANPVCFGAIIRVKDTAMLERYGKGYYESLHEIENKLKDGMTKDEKGQVRRIAVIDEDPTYILTLEDAVAMEKIEKDLRLETARKFPNEASGHKWYYLKHKMRKNAEFIQKNQAKIIDFEV